MVDAKQESESLMDSLLPLAKQMLSEYGEFYPYGGYITAAGKIVHVGAKDPDTDHPASQDLIDTLRNSFQELARTRQCRAIAFVIDVFVRQAGSDQKRDAIQVCLEHMDGYSVDVFLPYKIVSHEVSYGEIYATRRQSEIFDVPRIN